MCIVCVREVSELNSQRFCSSLEAFFFVKSSIWPFTKNINMMDCCIEGCKTSTKRDVMSFEFPTSRVLRKRWLDAINPGEKLAADARVCLRHFASQDYEAVRGRLRLRGKVVPTLFGDQARSPVPPKDPLDLPDINDESQESTSKEPTNDNHNGKLDNDNGKCHSDDEKIDNDDEKIDNHDEKCDNGKEKDPISSSKDATDNGHTNNEDVDNDNENIDKDNENIVKDNDNEIIDKDNDIGKDNTKAGNKRTASRQLNRKVKKKWVPMRKRPVERDSESEDSVNSDEPPPPILEDLEEHLPNYQIANMKTERQIAAMTETVDPLPEAQEEVEEIVMEPHIPVFIELSVGQDTNQTGTEQPNDCLMVLESVQCDIDPTLMLEARAEDEECCEQIDLDDDDDDDDVPAKITITKTPADPISLLTSSDEDDVILQEPHIDTLSVSDETDEDDLPLQKLIKREKKTKKTKKKKKIKPADIKSVLVGVTDYYCYHCQHVTTDRSIHDKHVRGHKKQLANDQEKTRVYQICKECGFTTSSKSQLHRHQRKHLNEKRYKCPLCSYRSKYNMSLMYHLKTHNFDPNMYNCGACGLKLDNKKALLRHQNTCYELGGNGDGLSCDKCLFTAESKRSLKMHQVAAHK